MATPSTVANKSSSSDVAPPRWSRSGEPGSTSHGPDRQPARGRPNRVRNNGRNNKGSQNAQEDKPVADNNGPISPSSDKPDRPALPEKPALSIAPPSSTKSKNSSRRPSRANTAQSSPVIETPISPASSNRRKRSGAGKGNSIPKINPPAPQDNLLRPGRPRIGAVPHSAPVKDPPPHLSHKSSHTPTGSFDMSKNIDALVERVRAVAMAENRPSTPGSHIDWAGEDDDSLPDLDDWGIPSLSDHKAQAISPIIVGGLKPLPELSTVALANAAKKIDNSAPPESAKKPEDAQHAASQPPSNADNVPSPKLPNGKVQSNSSLPPKPRVAPNVRVPNQNNKSRAPRRSRPPGEPKTPTDIVAAPRPIPEVTPSERKLPNGELDKGKSRSPGDIARSPHSSDQDVASAGGLAQSAHAPTSEDHSESEKEGLTASIHAPRAIPDSNSAPAHLNGRPPRERQTHGRAQTIGRPFPRANRDDTSHVRSPRFGRGGFHGSPGQHARIHSSPSTTNNRPPHSRPILTGDAISRLVKAVGNAATTSTKSTPTSITND
ncbi:hypothetical protein P691DRAFT_702372 [Macrolepiota fuliginosa MF-IS2]|uniref:Uncharacterized protein n=1 Tax=Macrolepiota fuliginosa MF-IS2 TaxID=1400762 RepID=A0A9P5XHL5_9AGAR|nr:hypothetical protein P691DRAFT_702372 [Macrolepiota fuliginosa MF-IS2]